MKTSNRRDESRKLRTYSQVEIESLDPIMWGTSPIFREDGVQFNSIGGKFVNNTSPLKARRFENILVAIVRMINGVSIFNNGSNVRTEEVDSQGLKFGIQELFSNVGGRAFYTATFTTTEAGFYSFSCEILEESGNLSTNTGIRNQAGTAVLGYGSDRVNGTNISAGGPGRYATIFEVVTPGTISLKVGVGLDSTVNNMSMKIRDLMMEKIDPTFGLVPSEYSYPEFVTTTNSMRTTTRDINGKISQGPAIPFIMKPYSNILAVGDSRSDEKGDIPDQLDILLAPEGRGCNWHAKGGWKASDIIGPTLVDGTIFTIDKAINSTALRRTISTGGPEQNYNMIGATEFDTLLICDLGFNDIASGILAVDVMTDIRTIIQAGLNAGLKIIVTDNNPAEGNPNLSVAELLELKELNRLLQLECTNNSYLFVQGYSSLGDSTNPDKLSDGAGTTPDYLQDDGLFVHPNNAGSLVFATLIKNATDSFRQ